MTLKKIKLIDEVISGLEEDSTGSTLIENMVCVCYAPHLGYRNWIFKYKTLYILLFDEGNGHYQYLCSLTWFDVVKAKISSWRDLVTAKWIEYQIPPMIVCSNCNYGTGVKEKKKLKKCPNCGAKMIGRR